MFEACFALLEIQMEYFEREGTVQLRHRFIQLFIFYGLKEGVYLSIGKGYNFGRRTSKGKE